MVTDANQLMDQIIDLEIELADLMFEEVWDHYQMKLIYDQIQELLVLHKLHENIS